MNSQLICPRRKYVGRAFAEIEKNDLNLNLPRYIDSQQAEDLQDIEGHLKGGLPERDVRASTVSSKEVCGQNHKAISSNGDRGEVRVRERWYLPTYRSDGTRVFEKRAEFDHQIDYTLRRIGGKWRIQSTTTPYAQ